MWNISQRRDVTRSHRGRAGWRVLHYLFSTCRVGQELLRDLHTLVRLDSANAEVTKDYR